MTLEIRPLGHTTGIGSTSTPSNARGRVARVRTIPPELRKTNIQELFPPFLSWHDPHGRLNRAVERVMAVHTIAARGSTYLLGRAPMKHILGILITAILALSASAAEPMLVPKTLKLSLGESIWGPTYRVELQNGGLHYTAIAGGKETTAVVVPTPQQWAAFRKALDSCNVWSWRSAHSAQADERIWNVYIAYSGAKVGAWGSVKQPGRKPNTHGSTGEFENFRKAVRNLLGGKSFE